MTRRYQDCKGGIMKRSIHVALALCVIAAAGVCILIGCSSSSPSGADEALEADLALTPTHGTILTDVLFDASGSTSRSRALECRWDYDGDGTWDTSWSPEMSFVARFTDGDTITVVVEVRDGDVTDEAEAQFILDKRHGHVVSDVMVEGTSSMTMGWVDGWLWRPQWGPPATLYKTDPTTGATVDTLPSPSQWPSGVAWDGASLWVSDYLGSAKMFEVNPTTGDTLSSFPIQYSYSQGGVAWDGEYIYEGICPSNQGTPGSISKYTTDGVLIDTIDPPRGTYRVQGIDHDGIFLWVSVADVDSLFAINPANGTVVIALHVPDLKWGVAVDDEGMLRVHTYGTGYRLKQIVP